VVVFLNTLLYGKRVMLKNVLDSLLHTGLRCLLQCLLQLSQVNQHWIFLVYKHSFLFLASRTL